MQATMLIKRRQKRCLYCHKLFMTDPRTRGKQRYCSKLECQTKRQRQNEKDWRIRNPECLNYQMEQSRQWQRSHPDYSRQRRVGNPALLQRNRAQTRIRMRKIRTQRMFDKSKVILTQLVGNKRVKCYLAHGSKWLHVRLTKASPLSKTDSIRDNHTSYKRIANCLPRGRLYDLSSILK